jgi:hypothetical protein
MTLLLRCETRDRHRPGQYALRLFYGLYCHTPIPGCPRLYLRRGCNGLRQIGSTHHSPLGLGAPDQSVVVDTYERLGRPTRVAWRWDGMRHQHRWSGGSPGARPSRPPGKARPEHQSTPPYRCHDTASPPVVGSGRPHTTGAPPRSPGSRRASPHTLPHQRVLALGHALQDLAPEVRRGGGREQAE